ncbi:hypothetical protein BGX34_009631 [Mortierella sp. NVP85]|nr:hypothetical protein BGX34_009631 [Mortierella sp. NVP85]
MYGVVRCQMQVEEKCDLVGFGRRVLSGLNEYCTVHVMLLLIRRMKIIEEEFEERGEIQLFIDLKERIDSMVLNEKNMHSILSDVAR